MTDARAAADVPGSVSPIPVRLTAIRYAARGVNLFEFRRNDGGGNFPPFEPGAHIDVHLPDGSTRQYSLLAADADLDAYTIAVKREANGAGGSRHLHDTARAGDLMWISPPRNNFPLHDDASHALLIAGGIGITPIWCMVQRLEASGRPWTLFYACRSAEEMAFRAALSSYASAHLHCDDEHAGATIDVAALVRDAPRDSHFYCCGPAPMLSAFEAATADRPRDRVHVEYFTAKQEAARSGGFVVELARSRRELYIPQGKTILEVLSDAGLDLPFSCEQGICGTCETRVLAGVPEHRDSILSAEEQASNATVMICCAGCKSERLVLDL